jgi:4,5-DOPA dioxygenase extradiol
MPMLFVGHGSPMNALPHSPYGAKWGALTHDVPSPSAVLMISAHWLTKGTFVHTGEKPPTIHDFYGFPPELYAITYLALGSSAAAHDTLTLVSPRAFPDTAWGLDHGAWSILVHMYPKANVPVFQMSIDTEASPERMREIGSQLTSLRSRGVLIIGSGNIVHNLGQMTWNENEGYDWANEADQHFAKKIQDRHDDTLLSTDYNTATTLAVPTFDHYAPLLYLLGASMDSDNRTFPIVGMAHGSISMRSVRFG